MYSTSPPRGSGVLQFENQWSMLALGPGPPRWAYLGSADVIVKHACGCPHTPSPVIGCLCKLQQSLISKGRQVSWQSLGGWCHHQSVPPGEFNCHGTWQRDLYTKGLCESKYPPQQQQAGPVPGLSPSFTADMHCTYPF